VGRTAKRANAVINAKNLRWSGLILPQPWVALMAFPLKKLMILATHHPLMDADNVISQHPGARGKARSRGHVRLMKVIASAVILAILGILFIVYNSHDDAMINFGWFLVVLGAFIAGVFTYLALKGAPEEPAPEPRGRRKRRR
jgi:hypothetical protein